MWSLCSVRSHKEEVRSIKIIKEVNYRHLKLHSQLPYLTSLSLSDAQISSDQRGF